MIYLLAIVLTFVFISKINNHLCLFGCPLRTLEEILISEQGCQNNSKLSILQRMEYIFGFPSKIIVSKFFCVPDLGYWKCLHFQEQKLNECKVKIKLTGDYKNTLISMKMGGGVFYVCNLTHTYLYYDVRWKECCTNWNKS